MCRLEGHPSSSSSPLARYDDGSSSSTFGAANTWSICPSPNVTAQNFSALPDPNCGKPLIPGDITGDGIVNVDDLLAVINSWGRCAGCPADIAPAGGDGVVNVDDLLAVINNWG